MVGISTDVIALATILGSAAVGGVVTLALADGPREASAVFAFECATTVVETAPGAVRVAIAGGDAGAAVAVGPRVMVRTEASCGESTAHSAAQLDRARAELERARARMARAQERIQRVDVQGLQALEAQLAEMERVLQAELEGFDAEELERMLERELSEELRSELRRLEQRLERMDGGNGR